MGSTCINKVKLVSHGFRRRPAGASNMLCEGGGGGKLSFMLPVGVKLRRRGVDPSARLLVRP